VVCGPLECSRVMVTTSSDRGTGRECCASCGHPCTGPGADAALVALRERDELRAVLSKINGIRDSIVGSQTVNWTEHVYPLARALDDAGMKGLPYPDARVMMRTLRGRTSVAEAERDEARAEVERMRPLVAEAIEWDWAMVADYCDGPAAREACDAMGSASDVYGSLAKQQAERDDVVKYLRDIIDHREADIDRLVDECSDLRSKIAQT
jgi:hypothetical protein